LTKTRSTGSSRSPEQSETVPGDVRTQIALHDNPLARHDPTRDGRLGNWIEIARRVDEAQNCVLALTIDRDDAAVRPVGRGRKAVRQHAFGGEIGANALALRQGTDCDDQADLGTATSRGDRLIGALAAKIF
jgi:hypothetical protein